jgi:hypothetical protein
MQGSADDIARTKQTHSDCRQTMLDLADNQDLFGFDRQPLRQEVARDSLTLGLAIAEPPRKPASSQD